MRILLNHKTWRILIKKIQKNLFLICTLNKSITFALKFRTKRNQAYEFVYLYILLLPSNLEQKEIRLMNLFTYTYYSYYYFYFGKKVEWEFVCMK
ncbi:hypothetical protein DW048_05250 [Phocaeicola vulgatus]|nr:hypothetical protein DW048_05250 [Phocaeicola vulgatus]